MAPPLQSQPSYQGGQCTDFYRFEGGEHTIAYYENDVEIDRYTATFGPDNTLQLMGPIVRCIPDVGDVVGGHKQGYVQVDATQGYIYRTFNFPYRNTATWSGSICIAATYNFRLVNGNPDKCGNNPDPPQQNPCTPPINKPIPGQPCGCECQPVSVPANSDFEIHSGAVVERIAIAPYQSLGETLSYDSVSATARPILHLRYSQIYNPHQTIIAKIAIQRGSFSYTIPGYPQAEYGLTGGENFWSAPVFINPEFSTDNPSYINGIVEAAVQLDLQNQPSGQYQYTLQRSVQSIDPNAPSFTPLNAPESASFIHINRSNSPFGAGWTLGEWQEIIPNPDGSLLLLDGGGGHQLFSAPTQTGSPYISPIGDPSRLEKLTDNSYRRTLPDQTQYTFNPQGKLTGITDRNGNQYTYNIAGRLTQITDPVNLKTNFTYTNSRVTQITDPANRITKLEYNTAGDLIKLTHPDNTVWQWEYQDHCMSASIDPRNHRASTRYDAFGRASEATRRDGSIVKIEPVAVKGLFAANQTRSFINPPPAHRWPDAQANSPAGLYTDGNGHILSAQVDARGSAVALSDPIGTMSRNQYNAQGLVQTQTNGRGYATDYTYDSKGNLTQITDSLSGALGKRYTYDPTFNQLATVSDELGRQTIYDIDPANGNVRSMNQVVGAVGGTDDQLTRYTYTAQGLVSTTTDALNRVTSYTYNAQGRLTKVVLAQGSPDQSTLNHTYDSAGNLATTADGKNNITKFFYDSFNRLIRVEEPDPDGTGPLAGPITRYTYDPNGNLTQVQDARNNITNYEYDSLNRLIKVTQPDPDGTGPLTGPVTTYGYDPVGNLLSVTDPLNHQTQYQYDARNRLVKIIDPQQGQIQFEYDLDNNVTAVIDPINNRTTFNHDARNRLISEVNALNKTRSYNYNAVNNLTSRIDRNNRTINFEYDELNRPTKEIWVGTTQQVNYSYDLVGNLKTITDQYSALTYSYDNQNRSIGIDTTGTPNLPGVLLNQTYDANSNRIKLTDTINGTVQGTETHSYDAINRLTQISQTGTGVLKKRVNFTYNPIHQMETLKRYADLTGTLLTATSSYSYDSMNRLRQLAHTQGASTTSLNTYSYGYDAASRIVQMSSVDGSSTYSYDDTDQVIGVSQSFQANESYGYDLNGNRTSAGYQSTTNNQLQTDGTYNYVYDDEGNLLKRTTIATNEVTEYTWDYRNRLTQARVKNAANAIIKQVNFVYDALNRRIEKKVDPDGSGPNPATIERFVYDRDHIKLVFNGSNTLIRRYLHGPMIDQILADENTVSKQISWPLCDHQGTIRDVVNNSGVVLNHIRYDSFGRITSQSAPALSPRFAYTGREWDGEIGLYFYRARYYNPMVGRFIGEDAIGFVAGDTNLTRYVGNSAINFTDPMGDFALAVPAGGFLIIIGITGVIILGSPEAQKVAQELIRRGIRALPMSGDLPWWGVPSKTAREGDNYIAKECRQEAGRNGDPCDVWKKLQDQNDEALRSTRNKQEIKALKSLAQELKKAGKQLGCDNKAKRKGSIEFRMQMFMANILVLYSRAESLENSLSPENQHRES